jgi:uncharacterized phage protein (TIGR01671 family)
MKDIKFRVWDNNDYMSTPFTLQDLQLRKVQFTEDCPVMQYTGLKDKNGKEIYEGDIVMAATAEMNDDFTISTEIFYDEDIQNVYWDEECAGWWLTENRYNQTQPMAHRDRFEIIGNIYEHSHLLKTEQ